MSNRHETGSEDSRIILEQWKVGEIQLSGDMPPPSKELDDWLYKLMRNDRSAAKFFDLPGERFVIKSYWTDSTGKVLHLRLKRLVLPVQHVEPPT